MKISNWVETSHKVRQSQIFKTKCRNKNLQSLITQLDEIFESDEVVLKSTSKGDYSLFICWVVRLVSLKISFEHCCELCIQNRHVGLRFIGILVTRILYPKKAVLLLLPLLKDKSSRVGNKSISSLADKMLTEKNFLIFKLPLMTAKHLRILSTKHYSDLRDQTIS